ncbi:MAG: formate dehydrogenase accessory sulfurtransferase FdhD [Candidatus Omnitrophota bacterium]
MAEFDALRIDRDGKRNIKDIVTEEAPLTIYLGGKELLTLLCSPDSLKELSIGFLYSSGIIKSMADIKDIAIDDKNWVSHVELSGSDDSSELIFKRLFTSGCGRGTLFYNALDLAHKKIIKSDITVLSDRITALMNTFQDKSVLFKETGGVHSAALSDGERILAFKEDIGRHNAVDKIIGDAVMKGLDMINMIVLTSGRISSEIVHKVAKMRSPVLISRSAPTDQAVRAAREIQLTLIGFARGSRMNVYTGEERIV